MRSVWADDPSTKQHHGRRKGDMYYHNHPGNSMMTNDYTDSFASTGAQPKQHRPGVRFATPPKGLSFEQQHELFASKGRHPYHHGESLLDGGYGTRQYFHQPRREGLRLINRCGRSQMERNRMLEQDFSHFSPAITPSQSFRKKRQQNEPRIDSLGNDRSLLFRRNDRRDQQDGDYIVDSSHHIDNNAYRQQLDEFYLNQRRQKHHGIMKNSPKPTQRDDDDDDIHRRVYEKDGVGRTDAAGIHTATSQGTLVSDQISPPGSPTTTITSSRTLTPRNYSPPKRHRQKKRTKTISIDTAKEILTLRTMPSVKVFEPASKKKGNGKGGKSRGDSSTKPKLLITRRRQSGHHAAPARPALLGGGGVAGNNNQIPERPRQELSRISKEELKEWLDFAMSEIYAAADLAIDFRSTLTSYDSGISNDGLNSDGGGEDVEYEGQEGDELGELLHQQQRYLDRFNPQDHTKTEGFHGRAQKPILKKRGALPVSSRLPSFSESHQSPYPLTTGTSTGGATALHGYSPYCNAVCHQPP